MKVLVYSHRLLESTDLTVAVAEALQGSVTVKSAAVKTGIELGSQPKSDPTAVVAMVGVAGAFTETVAVANSLAQPLPSVTCKVIG